MTFLVLVGVERFIATWFPVKHQHQVLSKKKQNKTKQNKTKQNKTKQNKTKTKTKQKREKKQKQKQKQKQNTGGHCVIY